jgi:3-hydroxy-5-methyl-1-naphthoate 3-O-methyltransferase
LLAALAALGFLVHHDGHYALTQPARDFLLPSSPYYRGAWLELVRRRPRLTYQDIAGALRRNRMLDDHYWEVEDTDPEQARMLAQALHVLSLPAAPALAAAADCSRVRHLLDVGGGTGSMSVALTLAYPALRCTVLDRQVPCALATEHIAAHALEARIATHPADMFTDAWPAGHDAILLSNILNCFDATRCSHLLEKAHDCLPSGGVLYLQEMLLPTTHDGPLALTALSLHGRLWGQGKQWTAGELMAMLTHAGFTLERLTPAYGYNVVLTAIKP